MHAGVLEPYSKRLWIIGGSFFNLDDPDEQLPLWIDSGKRYTRDILVMSFNSKAPLKLLSKESVVRFTHKHIRSLNAPKNMGLWGSLEIPEHLWSELETCKKIYAKDRHTGISKQLDYWRSRFSSLPEDEATIRK